MRGSFREQQPIPRGTLKLEPATIKGDGAAHDEQCLIRWVDMRLVDEPGWIPLDLDRARLGEKLEDGVLERDGGAGDDTWRFHPLLHEALSQACWPGQRLGHGRRQSPWHGRVS